MAYFWVQLLAVCSYFALSVLYMWAISGTRGSSGLGSVRSEQIESNTYNDVCIYKIMIPHGFHQTDKINLSNSLIV